MENISDEELITCPYDSGHRMLRKRLQMHLMKCRLNYPDVELYECPLNKTHMVPEPEIKYHLASCPDRKIVLHYMYEDVKGCSADAEIANGVKHAPIECEENWDDTDAGSYNPDVYASNMPIIRQPLGVQPSQRRIFRVEEERRLQKFEDEEEY
ncbi:gametocyte-specific factor 1 homolog [Eurosta solidaginis]|uniref:gametocyte-specific factor 1 homolog n=1 Tax=Eurosta solidaginis TaxID=178769 RepID=UPI0035314496